MPVRWARTPAGENIPLDVEPAPDGNIVMTRGVGGAIARVLPSPRKTNMTQDDRIALALAVGQPRYVSHFATCPQGRDWRRSP